MPDPRQPQRQVDPSEGTINEASPNAVEDSDEPVNDASEQDEKEASE